MKKILVAFLAVFVAFGFVACSQSSNVISLPKYEMNAKTADMTRAITLRVSDQRAKKDHIAVLTNASGDVNEFILPKGDLSAWLEDSLRAKLATKGISVIKDEQMADFKTNVYIKNLIGKIDGIGSQNMSGDFEILIELIRGNQTITKRITQPQTDFAMVPSMKYLEPFMQGLLKDIVERSANEIATSY